MNGMGRMCLNWKVIAGLAAVGAGIFVFAPSLLAASLPLLLVAACPLSMLAMMWGMSRMGGMQGSNCSSGQQRVLGTDMGLSRAQQIQSLQTELQGLQARQATIAEQIAALERTESRERSRTALAQVD